VLGKS
jgi:hypothetical protein